MNKKLIVSIILAIVFMFVIFSFSNETQQKSDKLSKSIINKSINIYEKISGANIDRKDIVKNINTPVRKVAHFTLYFVLSFLIYNIVIRTKIKNKEIITVAICIIYAFTDEYHQLFIKGRAGEIKDVFIDSLGAISFIIVYLILKNKSKLENAK